MRGLFSLLSPCMPPRWESGLSRRLRPGRGAPPVRRRLLCLLLCAALLLCACGCGGGSSLERDLARREDIAAALRQGLRGHAHEVVLRFSHPEEALDRLPALAEGWMEQALAETGDPAEGDYLRYQMGGYRIDTQAEPGDGSIQYQVTVTPAYFCYLAQEEKAGEKAAELLESFGFTEETGELERLRTIYDYVCQNIQYDRVHRKNPYYQLRSTAYAGLVQGAATCQGYAVVLYRLLGEAGLNCRVVTGSSGADRTHAWNLVELDGLWYHLDATWDAGTSIEGYRYFLRGSRGLDDHSLDPAFETGGFAAAHPIAREDWEKKGEK